MIQRPVVKQIQSNTKARTCRTFLLHGCGYYNNEQWREGGMVESMQRWGMGGERVLCSERKQEGKPRGSWGCFRTLLQENVKRGGNARLKQKTVMVEMKCYGLLARVAWRWGVTVREWGAESDGFCWKGSRTCRWLWEVVWGHGRNTMGDVWKQLRRKMWIVMEIRCLGRHEVQKPGRSRWKI